MVLPGATCRELCRSSVSCSAARPGAQPAASSAPSCGAAIAASINPRRGARFKLQRRASRRSARRYFRARLPRQRRCADASTAAIVRAPSPQDSGRGWGARSHRIRTGEKQKTLLLLAPLTAPGVSQRRAPESEPPGDKERDRSGGDVQRGQRRHQPAHHGPWGGVRVGR